MWLGRGVPVAAVDAGNAEKLCEGEAGDESAAANTGGEKNEAFGD